VDECADALASVRYRAGVSEPTWLFAMAIALLGLIVGSFANVVIARVPEGRSIVRPGSSCPRCSTPISPRDNIPVLSWVLLRGRCRHCGEPISWRYPVVEMSVAAVWLILGVWAFASDRLGLLPLLLAWGFVGVCLTVIDLDHHRLPDALTLPMLIVTPVGLILAMLLGDEIDWIAVVAGAVIWGGFLLLLWLLSAGRGMGLGDVKMAPSLGALLGALGIGPAIAGLAIGFIVGGVVGAGLLLLGRAGRGTRIAFGPFLLVGALLGIVAGPALTAAYVGVI
jgi:leader peptidase (prepilin peptidase)/N-methyltransferase